MASYLYKTNCVLRLTLQNRERVIAGIDINNEQDLIGKYTWRINGLRLV